MIPKTNAAALAVLSIALLAGCSSHETSDAIPRISTPARRDALILRELERQTELLRQINDKLNDEANDKAQFRA
jgi:outer membrane murein-binding lipoprotein Lpp